MGSSTTTCSGCSSFGQHPQLPCRSTYIFPCCCGVVLGWRLRSCPRRPSRWEARPSMMVSPLAARAEAAIRRLRDVDGVSVRADGEELTEIHVVTSSRRSPKQIVRDVQAVLRTDLAQTIDHRIVSVALARSPGAGPAAHAPTVAPAEEPAVHRSEERR